jgi:DNA-directed RNA polymerase subunit RPC12/RpoP
MNKERQELWCHECERYVQFNIDMELNGNHVIICPNCGHEHCRVVQNGFITENRWDRRNGGGGVQTYSASGITSTSISTYAAYSTVSPNGCVFTYGSWLNSGTGSGYC